MKITIETSEPTTVQLVQPAAEVSTSAGAAPTPAGSPAAASGFSLTDLLAKAASLGAINAGPAPSLSGAAIGPAPIALSVGGASPEPLVLTSSAGSPPAHVYGSKGGGK